MKIKKFAAVISVLFIITLLCSVLVSCTGYDVTRKEGNPEKIKEMQVREDGSFKILQLTDMHLIGNGNNKRDKQTLQWMIDAIDMSKPDLVEFTGDIAGNDKKSRNNGMLAIANIMEEKKQYWAYTCGNHDGEWDVIDGKKVWVGRDGKKTKVKDVCSQAEYYEDLGELYFGDNTLGNQDIFDQLKGYEYCVSRQDPLELVEETRASMGVGNYIIDLKDANGKVVYAIFHMDSHGKMYIDQAVKDKKTQPADVGYVGITNRQVKWYEDNIKPYVEKGITSSLWMHIPTFAFREAVEELDVCDKYPEGKSNWGIPQFREIENIEEIALNTMYYDKHKANGFLKEEGVYGPRWNDGLIDVMDTNRSTNMVAVGHDHNNAFYIHKQFPSAANKEVKSPEDDFMLCYGRCSGVNAWGRRVKIGATVYTIHTDAKTTEEMYDIKVIFPQFKYVEKYAPAEIDSRNGK